MSDHYDDIYDSDEELNLDTLLAETDQALMEEQSRESPSFPPSAAEDTDFTPDFGAAFDDELQDEMRVTGIATGFAEKRQSPAKPIGAFSAAQKKASASKNQAQEDIDDIDEIFKIFNRN